MEMPYADSTTWTWKEKLLGRFMHAGGKGADAALRFFMAGQGRPESEWNSDIDEFQSISLTVDMRDGSAAEEGLGQKGNMFIKRHPAASRILGFSFGGGDGLIGPCWLKESFRVWT